MANSALNKDEFICGLFDSDGSISISIINRERKKKKYKIPLGFVIKFRISQAEFNSGLFDFLKDNFDIDFLLRARNRKRNDTITNQIDGEVLYTQPLGAELVSLFKRRKPINPRLLNDFLIAEKIVQLLDQRIHFSKQGLITLIYLAYKSSSEQSSDSTVIKKKPIEEIFQFVFPNYPNYQEEKEFAVGMKEGEVLYKPI